MSDRKVLSTTLKLARMDARGPPREDVEMFCEQCDRDGTYAMADGFCANCTEYLCIVCMKYHKKYMPNHVQQNKANMPPDFCLVRCSSHSREIIKFYCPKCDDTVCPKCWQERHKKCSDMKHIPTLLWNTTFNHEWKDLKKSMKEISEGLSIIKEDADASLKQVSFNRSDVLALISKRKEEMKQKVENQRVELFDEMDRYRAEVIRKLDQEQSMRKQQLQSNQKQLHRKIDEQASKLATQSGSDQVKLQDLSQKAGTKLTEFRSMTNDLEKKEKGGLRSQLFISMKNAKHEMAKYKQDINSLRTQNEAIFYHFDPDDNCSVNIDSPDMNVTLGSIKAASKYPYVDI